MAVCSFLNLEPPWNVLPMYRVSIDFLIKSTVFKASDAHMSILKDSRQSVLSYINNSAKKQRLELETNFWDNIVLRFVAAQADELLYPKSFTRTG